MSSESVTDIKFAKRFSVNLVTNILSLVLSVLVGLLLIPYFIDTLGEAAYGLVPLATSVTTYVTLLVESLNVATGRYLMFDLRAGKVDDASNTFSTSFVTIIFCVALLIPLAIIFAFISPYIFSIGEINTADVTIMFGLIFCSALINMIKSNFTLALYSYNRIYLNNCITITQTVVQIGLIVLLFTIQPPSLISIGVAYGIASIVSLTLANIFRKRFCHELQIRKELVSKEKFTTLLSMSIWTLVKYSGCLLRSNISLVVINIICGAIAGAEYAIVLMWQTLLISIGSTLTNIFTPNIYSYCSKEDVNGLFTFISLAVRTSVIAVGLLIGLVSVYSGELLSIWVGYEFSHLGLYATLLLIPVLFRVSADVVNNVLIAKLRVRENSLIYCVSGILTAIASVIGAMTFGIPGVIIGGGIVMIMCEFFLILVRTSILINVKAISMVKLVVPGLIILALSLVFGNIIKIIFSGDTIVSLIMGGTVIAIPICLIATRLLLKKNDKEMIRACIPKALVRCIPRWIL